MIERQWEEEGVFPVRWSSKVSGGIRFGIHTEF